MLPPAAGFVDGCTATTTASALSTAISTSLQRFIDTAVFCRF